MLFPNLIAPWVATDGPVRSSTIQTTFEFPLLWCFVMRVGLRQCKWGNAQAMPLPVTIYSSNKSNHSARYTAGDHDGWSEWWFQADVMRTLPLTRQSVCSPSGKGHRQLLVYISCHSRAAFWVPYRLSRRWWLGFRVQLRLQPELPSLFISRTLRTCR